MITPDTIITADILAGLDKCPFCGDEFFRTVVNGGTPIRTEFKCGTWLWVGKVPQLTKDAELVTLRARVSELEAKVKRIVELGDSCVYEEMDHKEIVRLWTKAKEGE